MAGISNLGTNSEKGWSSGWGFFLAGGLPPAELALADATPRGAGEAFASLVTSPMVIIDALHHSAEQALTTLTRIQTMVANHHRHMREAGKDQGQSWMAVLCALLGMAHP